MQKVKINGYCTIEEEKRFKSISNEKNLGDMALVQQDEVWSMRRLVNLHKMKRPIGKIIVNIDLCKDCRFCIEFCPNGVLEESKDVNSKGYHYPVVKPGKELDCVACRMCEKVCPDFAITVVSEEYITYDKYYGVSRHAHSAELYKKDLDKLLRPGIHFLDGNTAVAEGAITAGCRFYAGYPITPPSNEIAEYMSYRLPQVGGKFIQMEDEIGSIMAVLGGASAAGGVKSMTATSGPGFSLMQEEIGLGSMLEIPALIVDVMRAGPSTGIPTLLGQGDILQAKYGSHGDYEIVAYLPANPQEAFDFTIKAINMAEKYRVVAIVLSDQLVGHMYGKVRVPEFDEIEIVERPKPTVPPPDQYLPYDSRYLVPPMAIAGTGYRANNESLTHTDKGYPTTDRDASFKLVMRLVRKIRENEKEIAEWEEYMLDDAEYVIVSYGSTSGSVRRAIKVLRAQGYRVGMLRPKTAWPFPGWVVENLASRGVQKFVTVEVNMGKMYHVVREFSRGVPVEHIPYAPPGYIPDPDYVINNVRKVIEG